MKVSPCTLLTFLLTIASSANNSYSFTLHTKYRAKTRLLAGFTTDSYLNSLSQVVPNDDVLRSLSATETYLNHIASFLVANEDSMAWEDYSTDFMDSNIVASALSTSEGFVADIPYSPIESIKEINLTPENFFMAQLPSSSIDTSNDFIYIPKSAYDINEVSSTLVSTSIESPTDTYYMKEIIVASNDNVIGPVASDSTSDLVENILTPSQADQIVSTADSVVNKVAEAASTVDSIAQQTTFPPKVEDLANALSGMSYDTLAQEPTKLSSALQQTRLTIPSFDAIPSPTIPSFDAIKDIPSFETIKNTKVFSDVQGVASKSFSEVQQAAGTVLQTSTTQLVEQSNEVVQTMGQTTLKQLGNNIIVGIQDFAKLMLVIIDDIAQQLFGDKASSTTSNIFNTAYISITESVTSASSAISNTIQDIGSMTIAQAAQSFVALVVLIVKLLFSILNSLIEMATSGSSSLTSITGTAMAAITQQADILSSRASALGNDVGNIKLAQLADMTGSFLQYSSEVMGQTYATVMELGNGGVGFGEFGIDPSYFETFTTALSNLPSL